MVKLSKSQLVRQLAKKSFNECDLDRDGKSPSTCLLSLGPCGANFLSPCMLHAFPLRD